MRWNKYQWSPQSKPKTVETLGCFQFQFSKSMNNLILWYHLTTRLYFSFLFLLSRSTHFTLKGGQAYSILTKCNYDRTKLRWHMIHNRKGTSSPTKSTSPCCVRLEYLILLHHSCAIYQLHERPPPRPLPRSRKPPGPAEQTVAKKGKRGFTHDEQLLIPTPLWSPRHLFFFSFFEC